MSGGYDDVYRGVNVTLDARLLQEIAAAKNSPQLPLNAERGRQFDEIVRNVVTERLRPGVSIPADVAKTEIEKSLGQHARKFSSELRTPEENALGEALTGARTAFRGLMARSIGNDPARLRALDRLDADYPNWLAIRAAADRAKAQGGQFTPFQLQSTAHRGLPIREWADIGQRVLPTTVGNSFTADRAAVGQVAGLAATGGLGAVLGSPALIAATALPLAYSRTGTRWLQGAVTPEELQLLSPYISRAATFGLLSDPDKPTR
jgi:hypothetical protein